MNKLRRGTVVAALLAGFCVSAFGKQPLEQIERKEIPVSGDVALTLHLADGTVHVYGANEPVVRLMAIKKAFTKERLDGIKVEVATNGNALAISTQVPAKPEGLSFADRSGTIDYVLIVPQTCTLQELTVENGEVVVDGLRGGGVHVRLTNGRILAMNCFAPTDLQLARGGIDLLFYWWENLPVAINATSTNGDLTLGLPSDAAARINAATHDGWIRNEFARDAERDNDSATLRTEIGANGATEITLRATSGNIRIGKTY